jgi:hypothetical protein
MFNYQNILTTIMSLIPSAIQQGASIGSFIITTLQTKPLALMSIFVISDWGLNRWWKTDRTRLRNNVGFAIGVLTATIVTGPFIIYWGEGVFHYINDKIVDITDDFFNYTSALGM